MIHFITAAFYLVLYAMTVLFVSHAHDMCQNI